MKIVVCTFIIILTGCMEVRYASPVEMPDPHIYFDAADHNRGL